MQVGQQVKGSYMGHQFAGVIESQRPLSVPTDGAFERFVKLTAPIVVFGLERSTLVMFTKYDGSPSSYTRYSESMEAA